MKSIKTKPNYKKLLADIGVAIETARQNAVKAVNTELVKENWEIGRHIVEFEQQCNERAEYGTELLARLSKDLRLEFGKGFGRRNILDMRRFYLCYQKWQAVPAKLSWTHIITLQPSQTKQQESFMKTRLCLKTEVTGNWKGK
jgi:hypothetical protein